MLKYTRNQRLMILEIIQKYCKYKSIALLSVVFLFYFSSCNVHKSTNVGIDEKTNLKYMEIFHNAGIQRMLGNEEKALLLYSNAAEINPNSASANYFCSVLHYKNQDYGRSLYYIKKAVNSEPEQMWYRFLLASVYSKTGDYKKSEKEYKILIKNNPKLILFYKDLIDLHLIYKSFDSAVEVYKMLVDNTFSDEEYALLIYTHLQNTPKTAADFIDYLVKLFPDKVRYQMLKAEQYRKIGNTDEAEKIYMKYYNSETENYKVLVTLYNYFYNTDKKDITSELQKRIINSDADLNTKFQIAELQSKNDIPSYLTTLKKLEKSYPDSSKVSILLGDYLSDNNNSVQAFKYYSKAYETEKNNYFLVNSILTYLDSVQNIKLLESYADTALEYMPNRPLIYLFLGKSQLYNGMVDKALSNFRTGESLLFSPGYTAERFWYYKLLCFYADDNKELFDSHYQKINSNSQFYFKAKTINTLFTQKGNEKNSKYPENIKNIKNELPLNFFIRAYSLSLFLNSNIDEAMNFLKENSDQSDFLSKRFYENLKLKQYSLLIP